jgi:hypothetical protein
MLTWAINGPNIAGVAIGLASMENFEPDSAIAILKKWVVGRIVSTHLVLLFHLEVVGVRWHTRVATRMSVADVICPFVKATETKDSVHGNAENTPTWLSKAILNAGVETSMADTARLLVVAVTPGRLVISKVASTRHKGLLPTWGLGPRVHHHHLQPQVDPVMMATETMVMVAVLERR